jgi:hypothetical protein
MANAINDRQCTLQAGCSALARDNAGLVAALAYERFGIDVQNPVSSTNAVGNLAGDGDKIDGAGGAARTAVETPTGPEFQRLLHCDAGSHTIAVNIRKPIACRMKGKGGNGKQQWGWGEAESKDDGVFNRMSGSLGGLAHTVGADSEPNCPASPTATVSSASLSSDLDEHPPPPWWCKEGAHVTHRKTGQAGTITLVHSTKA